MNNEQLFAFQLLNLNQAMHGVALAVRRVSDEEGRKLLDETMVAFSQELARLAQLVREAAKEAPLKAKLQLSLPNSPLQ